MLKLRLPTLLSRLNIRIGTKLAITVGIGVVLVAGMMVNQQISNASVAQQAELERNEQFVTADHAARRRRLAADADRHARNTPVDFRAGSRSSARRIARQHGQRRQLSAGRGAALRRDGKLRALRDARQVGQGLRRRRRRDDGAKKRLRRNRQAARAGQQDRDGDRRPDREGDIRCQDAGLATHGRQRRRAGRRPRKSAWGSDFLSSSS